MSLPPERISIKRRRQDEPVETLVLEPGLARDQKRRFTDFYFQRLRHDQPGGPALHRAGREVVPTDVASKNTRDYASLGIPGVRTSAPGDEVNDFAKYRNTHTGETENTTKLNSGDVLPGNLSLLPKVVAAVPNHPQRILKRRFHLMRDLFSSTLPTQAGSAWRPKPSLRPPLATFMEQPQNTDGSLHIQPPIDSIVELKEGDGVNTIKDPPTDESISRKTMVNTFHKSQTPVAKQGTSIRDDPMTWDHESDQLANELAMLAFDIDPADATEPSLVIPTPDVQAGLLSENEDTVINSEDDFIFETYIRVKHDPDAEMSDAHQNTIIGVLVIDDVNEDLWEKYIRSDDDDDDWDEEDEDSNAEDNPRNDYPDDEVSSDDEFGRNVYRYRQNASDDEQYDEEREV